MVPRRVLCTLVGLVGLVGWFVPDLRRIEWIDIQRPEQPAGSGFEVSAFVPPAYVSRSYEHYWS